MRKLFCLLMVCLVLILVGCQGNSLVIGSQTPYGEELPLISSFDGIDVQEVKIQNKACRFWLTNSTQSTFTINADYTLEVWQDGTWYMPVSPYDSDPKVDMLFLEHLQSGETKPFVLSLEYYDVSKLKPGQYRLVLQVGWGEDPPEDWVCIPFEVQ